MAAPFCRPPSYHSSLYPLVFLCVASNVTIFIDHWGYLKDPTWGQLLTMAFQVHSGVGNRDSSLRPDPVVLVQRTLFFFPLSLPVLSMLHHTTGSFLPLPRNFQIFLSSSFSLCRILPNSQIRPNSCFSLHFDGPLLSSLRCSLKGFHNGCGNTWWPASRHSHLVATSTSRCRG